MVILLAAQFCFCNWKHLPSEKCPSAIILDTTVLLVLAQNSVEFLTFDTYPTEIITLTNCRELLYMMAGTSLHKLYVMTPNITSSRKFYVIGNPINYTEKVCFPSVIS